MVNLEIKIRISNPKNIQEFLKSNLFNYCGRMSQKDIYFKVGNNKTKIREIDKKEIQFIKYLREEKLGQKRSLYQIRNISKKEEKEFLKNNKKLCEIYKERKLWIYNNTRIHLDKVKKLGNFLELETVLKNISKKEGQKEFNYLLSLLKINKNDSIPYSYSDLIFQN